MQRWLADGAPEGDPRDLPPPPQWTEGWQLGNPDLVVTLSQPYVLPADGTDVSRVFVLPLPVNTMRYVSGDWNVDPAIRRSCITQTSGSTARSHRANSTIRIRLQA